ncbi:uncharacterized protein N7443_010326 [Penicillium atrosanguineum]|uniref:uncharacterized protein n=1 Tax=Penicillium atrosanguineum TaxID=1132637 RepID=UPI00239E1077|nr:uncharacterized protein N7443_010326 [Penicillium atrosanguineum]KAJ5137381.1 hypothetical protein N7526_003614 [Penicillium atrosanguineum]KAJ5290073.1 hypothetical protein N7443_010326 [Penicillium atrosanguineum]
MAPFKVIIVGGSVAGLALANMFERYGIDYIVLEKYEGIAPQLGAGFAIMPNGGRLLDQLGCYEALAKKNEPVNSIDSFDEHGIKLGSLPDLGTWMEKTFGYKMRFMDRQQIIQGLWDNLHDNSKIRVLSDAVKVVCDVNGVAVETADGSVFHGDVVVGADGIHSKVKQEMQRIAADETPGRDLFPEKDGNFGGLFGISKAPEGVRQDQVVKAFRKGRSYLCAGGPSDTLYWLLTFKNEKETQGKSVPRYTEEDRQKLVEMCQDDIIRQGMTFGDIYERTINSALVPLEEGVLKTCYYKRMVLLGDSWHKVNPLSGLGGNNAFVSAASLADELKELLDRSDETPDEESLQNAFRNYQESRENPTRDNVAMANFKQRMEVLDNPILSYLQLRRIPKLDSAEIVNSMSPLLTSSIRLKHLPLASRQGILAYEHEVKIKARKRSTLANVIWILMLTLVMLVHYPLQKQSSPNKPVSQSSLGSLAGPPLALLHFHASVSVVNTIICIESYRKFFFMKPVGSALPFAICALIVGWEYITPVWFALFILATALQPFYFPAVRSIGPDVGLALWAGTLLTYGPVLGYSLWTSTVSDRLWMFSHAVLPFVVRLSRKLLIRWLNATRNSPARAYGEQDAKHLRNFIRMAAWIPFIKLASYGYRPDNVLHNIYHLGYSEAVRGEVAKKMLLDVAIVVFIFFVFWDLHRVGVRSLSSCTWVVLALGLGPATALGELWGQREELWEEARRRETVDEACDV